MIVLAVILAAVAAYLWVGFACVAPGYVTRKVQRDADQFPTLAADPAYVARERREAAGEAVLIAFFWLPYIAGRAITSAIAARAPLSNHERQQQAEREGDR